VQKLSAAGAESKRVNERIGIIGLGTMGRVLALGILAAGKEASVIGSARSRESAREAQALGIDADTDNRRVARLANVIVLCVKPYQAQSVLEEIAPELGDEHVLISICAAITIADLRQWSGGRAAIVRAMPNTPCLVGAGMTVLAPADGLPAEVIDAARRLFEPHGRTAVLEEALMDGVTGLSGCGPAYGYLIIESLAEAGVKLGIPRATATLLAAQTMLGSARMVLERGQHPAALKDEVTTPAGCTIDGLLALEDGKLRSTLIAGVVAAAERSRTLRTGP